MRALAGSGLLLLVLAAGCAGVEAPTDAEVGEFCAVWDRLADASTGEDLHAFGAGLEQVGTPPEIPDDARAGLGVVVRAVGELGPDDDLDDLAAGGLSEADLEDARAFLGYGRRTCGRPDAAGG